MSESDKKNEQDVRLKTQSTIGDILRKFYRSKIPPPLERQDSCTLRCLKCKKCLAWREPDGTYKEVYPLTPPGRRACLPTGEYCPRCGAPVNRYKFWKNKVINKDYEIIR